MGPQKSIFGKSMYSGADWQFSTYGGFGEILGLDSSEARWSRCFVNNNLPTATPTGFPTTLPSDSPTTATPTESPTTPSPTDFPTTAYPTTAMPTVMPTITPALWSFRRIGTGICLTTGVQIPAWYY